MDTSDSLADLELQANRLLADHRFDAAEPLLRELISSGTSSALVFGNLAAICGMTDRFDELEDLLRHAISLQPDFPDAYNNLGTALRRRGDLNQAIACYQQALHYRPAFPEAHYNLGLTHQRAHQFDQALLCFRRATDLRPDYGEAWLAIATLQQGLLRWPEAIAAFRQVLQLQPRCLDAVANLATCLQLNGDLQAALALHQQAIALDPQRPELHYNLANAFRESGALQPAIAAYQAALALQPGHAAAWMNLGMVFVLERRIREAVHAFHQAFLLRPDSPEPSLNLAQALLLQGRYRLGWRLYDSRLCFEGGGGARLQALPACRRWSADGLPDPPRPLLLVAEQGLGDSLQFVRYVPHLLARGYRVSLCVQPALQALLRSAGFSVSFLSPEEAAARREGVWLPLLSLPRYFHGGVASSFPSHPYLQAPDALVAQWRDRLGSSEAPLIGLHWQGNPSSEISGLQGRSFPLELFAPIAAALQIRLVALQKGPGHEQLQACSFRDRFVACQPQVDASWEFLDAAAILRHCDLLITNDTALAHLAGALGHPTWLLLHHVPDWRWGLQGDTTPWYPSLRLWRQHRRGDWPELLQRVLVGLQQRFPQAVR